MINLKSFNNDGIIIKNKNLINNLTDFISHVKFLEKVFFKENCWYRGQPNENYNLIPGIYRLHNFNFKEEENLKTTFVLRAKSIDVRTNFNNIWDWYQIMQHHGIPTRLLDWSEGYLIALFFSLRTAKSEINPAVWVIAPYTMNEISTGNRYIFYTDNVTRNSEDKIVDDYIDCTNINLPKYPICISPAHVNQRMQAQRSCFTVHGKNMDGIWDLANDNKNFKIVKLIINSAFVSEMKAELFSAGIGESTLFPDLDGLSRELKYEFGIK